MLSVLTMNWKKMVHIKEGIFIGYYILGSFIGIEIIYKIDRYML